MDNNVNRPHKGMMQDVNPVDQPKESYRYALNAVNETNEGNRTSGTCWIFHGDVAQIKEI